MIPAINSTQNNINFGAKHQPKTFKGLMSYLYKKAFELYPDVFERTDSMKITTNVDGISVTGYANFNNGKYRGLILGSPYHAIPGFSNKFKKAVLQNYKNNMKHNTPTNAHRKSLKPAKRVTQHDIMRTLDRDI